jgi:hypothetical protein
MEVKGTTYIASSTSFLDLYLEFDDSGQLSTELFGLQNGTSLHITVNLIANPLQTYIQWVFRKNDSIDSVIKSYNNSKGFTYTSNICIQTIISTQFGYYIVIVTNSIGSFRRTFTVIQQGKYYFYTCILIMCL